MPLRLIAYATTGSIVLLLVGALALSLPGAASPTTKFVPGDAALNHWVFDVGDATPAEVLRHAQDVVAHMKEAHPETTFVLCREQEDPKSSRLHYLLETVNTRAQRLFLDSYGTDDSCRALLEREDSLFELKEDVYLSLITADPEKERNLAPIKGGVVWSLDARFPRVGEAVECAERVVQHLNATYPRYAFRAYDEWFPRPVGIRIYVFASFETGSADWVETQTRIHRDPVFRELMEGAADAFTEGSFESTWLRVHAQ